MKRNLPEWLHYLENLHSQEIDMGLERVGQVRNAMQLTPQCPVIVVAGTNGKGSVCTFLSKIYAQAGFNVGTLTSPHLLRFNERIAINAQPVSDEDIIQSFEKIEAARGETSLSYFEFNALAAVDVFDRHHVDVMVLEVGLGGRLDAVNIFDADCAILTSVDVDHQAFLGSDIETIAHEKAHVFRASCPAICGQVPTPQAVLDYSQKIGAKLRVIGQDFAINRMDNQWSFTCEFGHNRYALPIPALRGSYQINNAACALAAIESLHDKLPVNMGAIKEGLLLVENPGRFQVLPGRPVVVLDVGHNPHAARALSKSLQQLPYAQNRIAVFSILADKDIDQVLALTRDEFDEWYIAPLHNILRGMSLSALEAKMQEHDMPKLQSFTSVNDAYQAALSNAQENDRIVVFGSFHTVAEVAQTLAS